MRQCRSLATARPSCSEISLTCRCLLDLDLVEPGETVSRCIINKTSVANIYGNSGYTNYGVAKIERTPLREKAGPERTGLFA